MNTYIWWKKWVEWVIALLLFTATSPLVFFCINLIPFLSTGPPIFLQKRLGKNREVFIAIKLRTRHVGVADGKGNWKNHNENLGIYPFGKFLRKYSIDELLQLINVLLGEMALIGPRAPQPGELERGSTYENRFTVDQGITGLAQVNGRDNLSKLDQYRLDLIYVEQQSFFEDLKIIILTPLVVFFGTGK